MDRGDADGKGIPENDVQAVHWFRMAAEQGHAAAQLVLGWMYENGEGIPEDYVKAYGWYSVSAAQGGTGFDPLYVVSVRRA